MKTAVPQPVTPLSAHVRPLFVGLAAALFDLDNTLIDTHIDFPKMKQATLALAADYGGEASALAGLDILRIVDTVREGLQKAGRETEAARFHAEAFTLLAEIELRECVNPTLLPGAAELLASLKAQDVPVAIVTRNCRAVSLRLIEQGGLHCDALLAREDVRRHKPHPDHLHDALRALQPRLASSPDPATCLMIGNHWMDVAAGHAARMRTIGLRRNRPAEDFTPAMPDLLLNDLAELWALLKA